MTEIRLEDVAKSFRTPHGVVEAVRGVDVAVGAMLQTGGLIRDVTAPLYFVVGLAAFGTMNSLLAGGVRIAVLIVGLVPFAALGIVIGHLASVESVGPIMGGATALFALLGGTWFPLGDGALHDIGEALPSYWLVQASHVALGGAAWSATGRLVVAAWSVAAAAVARWAYRRDTARD